MSAADLANEPVALMAQAFPFLLRGARTRCQVVTAAEVLVACAGQDRAADLAVFPQVDPDLGNLVGGLLVEDVRFLGVVQRDVGDAVALLIVDGQAVVLRV